MNRRLLILATAALLGSCSNQEQWAAFVYPPGQSLQSVDSHKALYGLYSTFEECQSAAINALREYQRDHQSEESGDYECGVGCRYKQGSDLYMCKETRK
jgi:hypothetical protein